MQALGILIEESFGVIGNLLTIGTTVFTEWVNELKSLHYEYLLTLFYSLTFIF